MASSKARCMHTHIQTHISMVHAGFLCWGNVFLMDRSCPNSYQGGLVEDSPQKFYNIGVACLYR